MAAAYTWPPSLPQEVLPDYSESGGVLILRTPVDKGPAKQRRTGARPDVLSVAFQMNATQLELFRTFVNGSIRGTARFVFPHPRLKTPIEVRMIPEESGKLFNVSYLKPNYWKITLSLEVMP